MAEENTEPEAASETSEEPRKGYALLNGKNYLLRPNLADDWAFTELTAGVENNSPSAQIKWAKFIFNDDPKAYEALKRECTVDGRVSTRLIIKKCMKVLEGINPNS